MGVCRILKFNSLDSLAWFYLDSLGTNSPSTQYRTKIEHGSGHCFVVAPDSGFGHGGMLVRREQLTGIAIVILEPRVAGSQC